MPEFTLESAPQDPIEAYRQELGSYYAEMQGFSGATIEEIFMKLAAWSARFSEIRGYLVRRETRKDQAFRTKEVDPFLEECDRQFRIYSRLCSFREFEWKVSGGAM